MPEKFRTITFLSIKKHLKYLLVFDKNGNEKCRKKNRQ